MAWNGWPIRAPIPIVCNLGRVPCQARLPRATTNSLVRVQLKMIPSASMRCVASLGMHGDVPESLRSILHDCRKERRWEHAILLLAGAGSIRISSDVSSVNTTISFCGNSQQWEIALQLFRRQSRKSESNVVTYNAMISIFQHKRAWRSALALFREMRPAEIQPDVVTYCTVISSLELPWQWITSVGLLADVAQCRVRPNQLLYNAVISSCEKSRQWQRAVAFLSEMQRKCIPAGRLSYSSAIRSCWHDRHWNAGLRLFHAMQDIGARLDMITCSTAIELAEASLQRNVLSLPVQLSAKLFHQWVEDSRARDLHEQHQIVALAWSLHARKAWHITDERAFHRRVVSEVQRRLSVLMDSRSRADGVLYREATIALEKMASLTGVANALFDHVSVSGSPAEERSEIRKQVDSRMISLLQKRERIGLRSSLGDEPIARLMLVWLRVELRHGADSIQLRNCWNKVVSHEPEIVVPTK